MDRVIRDILRSWNWPNSDSESFSKRPSPYRIAKNSGIAVSSVYGTWHMLFDTGMVRKILLFPSDGFAKRAMLVFTNASHDDYTSIISKVDQLYFLELLHFGHIYDAFGDMRVLAKGLNIVVAEVVDSSTDLVYKQGKIISGLMTGDTDTAYIFHKNGSVRLNEKFASMAWRLAYSDLYEINIESIATEMNISRKTVQMRIDSTLKDRILTIYPLLDQSVIEGFQVALVFARYEGIETKRAVIGLLKGMPHLYERYLLLRFIDGSLTLIIYYDSLADLEISTQELKSVFQSFLIMTRFETYFNDRVTTNHR